MTVYAYVRSRADDGTGLRAQLKAIRDHAQGLGLAIDYIFQDSAQDRRTMLAARPQGGELWRRLAAEDVLIISSPAAAFRDERDALQAFRFLLGCGVTVCVWGQTFVPGAGTSAWLLVILEWVGAWRHEQAAEACRLARTQSKAAGRKLNGEAGYGYRWVGRGRRARRVAVPLELAVMKWLAQARAQDPPPSWDELREHLRDMRACQRCDQVHARDEATRQPVRVCPACRGPVERLRTNHGSTEWSTARLQRMHAAYISHQERAAQPAG
jgi:hypothetical protein